MKDFRAALANHPVFEIEETGDLAVAICYFNPAGYQSRKRNLLVVLDALARSRVPVFAAELLCGVELGRDPLLPQTSSRVIQIESDRVLWQKENLWNLIVERMPPRFQKVLCLDADILLEDQLWPKNISLALESFPIIHPYSTAVWLDPLGETLSERHSSGFAFTSGFSHPEDPCLYHPGFGFAARRHLWDSLGGLYNGPIGNGDWMMVCAALNQTESIRESLEAISNPYWHHYSNWALPIAKWTGGRLGCLDARALHLWHGSKRDRHYVRRMENIRGFDPYIDISTNSLSLLSEWSEYAIRQKPKMIDETRNYFDLRREDSLET